MHFNVGKKAKRRGEVLWGITHGAAGGRPKELSRTAFLCENVKRRRERQWGIGERTEGNGVKASEMEGKGGSMEFAQRDVKPHESGIFDSVPCSSTLSITNPSTTSAINYELLVI